MAADRHRDAVFLQPLLELPDAPAGFQRGFRHIVERDKIDMSGIPFSRSASRSAWASLSFTPSIIAYS
jgi:hypothetical protein